MQSLGLLKGSGSWGRENPPVELRRESVPIAAWALPQGLGAHKAELAEAEAGEGGAQLCFLGSPTPRRPEHRSAAGLEGHQRGTGPWREGHPQEWDQDPPPGEYMLASSPSSAIQEL